MLFVRNMNNSNKKGYLVCSAAKNIAWKSLSRKLSKKNLYHYDLSVTFFISSYQIGYESLNISLNLEIIYLFKVTCA